MQITRVEAQTWIRWATDIKIRTERLKESDRWEDAAYAYSSATRLLDYMHQVFVVGAEIETGADVRHQSHQYLLQLRRQYPEFQDAVELSQ